MEKFSADKPARKRSTYSVVLLLVIALGLASRRYPELFPDALGKYPGDALWALMVFVGWAIVFPACSTVRILTFALGTSYCIEFCKLYQTPWLQDLRNSTLGHLVFGSSFSWQNLVAYTLGAAVGAMAEWMLLRKRGGTNG